jgi:hypothetical protein
MAREPPPLVFTISSFGFVAALASCRFFVFHRSKVRSCCSASRWERTVSFAMAVMVSRSYFAGTA